MLFNIFIAYVEQIFVVIFQLYENQIFLTCNIRSWNKFVAFYKRMALLNYPWSVVTNTTVNILRKTIYKAHLFHYMTFRYCFHNIMLSSNMSTFVPEKLFLRGVLLHYFYMKKSAAKSHRILVVNIRAV